MSVSKGRLGGANNAGQGSGMTAMGGYGRRVRRRLRDDSGGVMMEYVILAVLIAAAVVVAVVVFSRSVTTTFITTSQSATLREKTAKEQYDTRRKARDRDAGVARDYHDSMHESQ